MFSVREWNAVPEKNAFERFPYASLDDFHRGMVKLLTVQCGLFMFLSKGAGCPSPSCVLRANTRHLDWVTQCVSHVLRCMCVFVHESLRLRELKVRDTFKWLVKSCNCFTPVVFAGFKQMYANWFINFMQQAPETHISHKCISMNVQYICFLIWASKNRIIQLTLISLVKYIFSGLELKNSASGSVHNW